MQRALSLTLVVAMALILATAGLTLITPVAASASDPTLAAQSLALVNADRTSRGLPALTSDPTLTSIASGWIAAASAFVLFLGVHALESYILTPILQRQALDIPPATLFAFQILLGVVFGIWGLALALPVMAIAKVMVDYFKADETSPDAMTG